MEPFPPKCFLLLPWLLFSSQILWHCFFSLPHSLLVSSLTLSHFSLRYPIFITYNSDSFSVFLFVGHRFLPCFGVQFSRWVLIVKHGDGFQDAVFIFIFAGFFFLQYSRLFPSFLTYASLIQWNYFSFIDALKGICLRIAQRFQLYREIINSKGTWRKETFLPVELQIEELGATVQKWRFLQKKKKIRKYQHAFFNARAI